MNDYEKYVYVYTLEEIENMTQKEREELRQRMLTKYGNLKDDIVKQFDTEYIM